MAARINISKLLLENPNVSARELKRNRDALRELRCSGVQARGYRLAGPYDGRRVRVVGDSREDAQVVRLAHQIPQT